MKRIKLCSVELKQIIKYKKTARKKCQNTRTITDYKEYEKNRKKWKKL